LIPLSLKQLRYFATAAELSNLSKAALKLHISQPSISMAIAALEDYYAQPLLIRNPGTGVSTTPFGCEVLKKVTQLLHMAEQLSDVGSAKTIDASVIGTIAIGCFSELAAFFMPAALRLLKQEYPHINVTLKTGDFAQMSAGLSCGELDFIVSYELALDQTVLIHRLKQVVPYALLPANHRLAAQRTIHLSELLQEPLIMTDDAYSAEHLMHLLSGLNLTPKVAFVAPSFELLRGLVANQHGVAVAYSQTKNTHAYDGERVVSRPLADAIAGNFIVLARCKTFALTLPAKAAWQCLEKNSAGLLERF